VNCQTLGFIDPKKMPKPRRTRLGYIKDQDSASVKISNDIILKFGFEIFRLWIMNIGLHCRRKDIRKISSYWDSFIQEFKNLRASVGSNNCLKTPENIRKLQRKLYRKAKQEEGECPAVKNIGKPCAGKPHARFDEGGLVEDRQPVSQSSRARQNVMRIRPPICPLLYRTPQRRPLSFSFGKREKT